MSLERDLEVIRARAGAIPMRDRLQEIEALLRRHTGPVARSRILFLKGTVQSEGADQFSAQSTIRMAIGGMDNAWQRSDALGQSQVAEQLATDWTELPAPLRQTTWSDLGAERLRAILATRPQALVGMTAKTYTIERVASRGPGILLLDAVDPARKPVTLRTALDVEPARLAATDRREYNVVEELEHDGKPDAIPGLARPLDIGFEDLGLFFSVLPRVTGRSLADVAYSMRPVHRVVALKVVLRLAEVLEAMHRHNEFMVHLFRSSVVIDDMQDPPVATILGGGYLISKSGVALRDHWPELTPLTAPEVGRNRIDARTDVWALGFLTLYMALGREPSEQDYQNLGTMGDWGATPELVQIVKKSIAADPDQRYRFPSQLSAALQKIGVRREPERPAPEVNPAPPPPPVAPPSPTVDRPDIIKLREQQNAPPPPPPPPREPERPFIRKVGEHDRAPRRAGNARVIPDEEPAPNHPRRSSPRAPWIDWRNLWQRYRSPAYTILSAFGVGGALSLWWWSRELHDWLYKRWSSRPAIPAPASPQSQSAPPADSVKPLALPPPPLGSAIPIRWQFAPMPGVSARSPAESAAVQFYEGGRLHNDDHLAGAERLVDGDVNTAWCIYERSADKSISLRWNAPRSIRNIYVVTGYARGGVHSQTWETWGRARQLQVTVEGRSQSIPLSDGMSDAVLTGLGAAATTELTLEITGESERGTDATMRVVCVSEVYVE